MKTIIVDGQKMTSVNEAHKYLKNTLELTELYGENLDALWDELSAMTVMTEIIIVNEKKMRQKLGEYADRILDLFDEVTLYNKNVMVSRDFRSRSED